MLMNFLFFFFSIVTQILKKISLFINILSKKMTLDFFFLSYILESSWN